MEAAFDGFRRLERFRLQTRTDVMKVNVMPKRLEQEVFDDRPHGDLIDGWGGWPFRNILLP